MNNIIYYTNDPIKNICVSEKSSVPNLCRTVKLVECILYSTDN